MPTPPHSPPPPSPPQCLPSVHLSVSLSLLSLPGVRSARGGVCPSVWMGENGGGGGGAHLCLSFPALCSLHFRGWGSTFSSGPGESRGERGIAPSLMARREDFGDRTARPRAPGSPSPAADAEPPAVPAPPISSSSASSPQQHSPAHAQPPPPPPPQPPKPPSRMHPTCRDITGGESTETWAVGGACQA